MIRVLIAAASHGSRARLERVVRQAGDVEVISSVVGPESLEAAVAQRGPDIVISDAPELAGADFPTIVLANDGGVEPGAAIRGVLPPDAAPGELRAAIDAVLAGLWVLHPRTAYTRTSSGEEGGPLSPREREVLAMVAEGLGNKIIAGRLGISENTVKFHVSSIMEKLGADSRTEAVTRGIRRGLVML